MMCTFVLLSGNSNPCTCLCISLYEAVVVTTELPANHFPKFVTLCLTNA